MRSGSSKAGRASVAALTVEMPNAQLAFPGEMAPAADDESIQSKLNKGEVVHALIALFMQPLFSLGFATYFLASVIWFRVVATEPLSLAYPILVSLTFTLVTAGAVLLFSEPLSLRKVVGLAVILAGIAIVSLEKGAT